MFPLEPVFVLKCVRRFLRPHRLRCLATHHRLVYKGWPEFNDDQHQAAPVAPQAAMLPPSFCTKVMATLLGSWVALKAGEPGTPVDGGQHQREDLMLTPSADAPEVSSSGDFGVSFFRGCSGLPQLKCIGAVRPSGFQEQDGPLQPAMRSTMRSGTLAADLGVRVSNALDGDGVRQDSTQVDYPLAPAGPAPVQGQGQAVQGRVHTSAAVELRDKLSRKLDSLRVHAREPGGAVELGLSSRLDGSTTISEVSLDGLLFSLIVHTLLAETFKEHGVHFSWTTARAVFGSQSEWSRMGSWVGSAALVLLVGEGPIVFEQRRPGRQTYTTEVGRTPFRFDPTVPFRVLADGDSMPFSIAFQHGAKSGIEDKWASQLNNLECVRDDPLAWTPLRRVPFSSRHGVGG